MTVRPDAIIADFQQASQLTGMLTRVARKLDLSPSHVRQVALGLRRSHRVMRELSREYRLLDRQKKSQSEAVAA